MGETIFRGPLKMARAQPWPVASPCGGIWHIKSEFLEVPLRYKWKISSDKPLSLS